ncbi:MAG TPA: ABC transporter substrate-binding protein [Gemmatimonadales bacterium]|nr:ABC transporter substrate-binding protein [Gemmatimonadales bacterium]
MRIASLLPSATEIVCALGAGKSLVGISHSCDRPAGALGLPRLTRTAVPMGVSSREIDHAVRDCLARGESLYTIDTEALAALDPDLVITQGLCDVCAVTKSEVDGALCVSRTAPRVLSLDACTLDQVLESVIEVGRAIEREAEAAALVADLRTRVERVRARSARLTRRPRVGFLEWVDPLMCGGHWNPELVALAGGEDGIGRAGEPSRTIEWRELTAWRPEVLIVACCGFTVERSRREVAVLRERPGFRELPCARSGRIQVFDGAGLFSRPGPALVDSLELLAGVLHPGD